MDIAPTKIESDSDAAHLGEEDEEEYDELAAEEDEDDDAVAKRLNDALWADIDKAYAEQAALQGVQPAQQGIRTGTMPSNILKKRHSPGPSLGSISDVEVVDDAQVLMSSIREVLNYASNFTALYEALLVATVSESADRQLLHVLQDVLTAGDVSPGLAQELANLVEEIAESDAFRNSADVLSNGKRKRASSDDGSGAGEGD